LGEEYLTETSFSSSSEKKPRT